ncbi:hypothetical protein FGE05_12735 [Pseudomonas sp. ICMP22404]|nr:hypothetical protein FGE05_12735 [Pseudomonas sp. ICMP22404]
MARGLSETSYRPAGARSGPKLLGLMRSPAGINPLATKSFTRKSCTRSSHSEIHEFLEPLALPYLSVFCRSNP